MSYIKIISIEEREKLEEVKESVRDHYDQAIPRHFQILSQKQFSEIEIVIENKIT